MKSTNLCAFDTQLPEMPDGVEADCIRPFACNAPLWSEREIMQGTSGSSNSLKWMPIRMHAKKFWSLIFISGVFACLLSQSESAEATQLKAAGKPVNTSVNTLTGEGWRKSSPKLPPPRPFKLPNVTTYKLDNGLTVQLVEDHRVPFATVMLGVKAGSAQEPAGLCGVADVTADMVTEGTKNRSSKQIAEEIDFIGGALKGGAELDYTLLTGSALSRYTDKLLDVLSDVVLNPSFPEEELKLKKTNLLQELVMKRSQPEFLEEERFAKVVFGDHPYGVVAPSPQDVEKMSAKDLQDFHSQFYRPNDAVLIAVGDFDSNKMKELIEKHFGESWKSADIPKQNLPSYPQRQGRRIYLVDRPGSVQSAIKLGNVAISKNDPDYFPLLLANQILGGAAHSRLFLNIREQKGFTYGAYSSFSAHRQPGPFAAEADVRTEVTGPALQEFLYELDRIRNLRVQDKELKDAKNYLSGSFSLGLETQAGLAQRLLEVQLYDLPADYLENYTNKIMAVNLDDVRRVARKDMDVNNMTIVVVGDGAKIKHDLEFFAPVETYDTAGKATKSAAVVGNTD